MTTSLDFSGKDSLSVADLEILAAYYFNQGLSINSSLDITDGTGVVVTGETLHTRRDALISKGYEMLQAIINLKAAGALLQNVIPDQDSQLMAFCGSKPHSDGISSRIFGTQWGISPTSDTFGTNLLALAAGIHKKPLGTPPYSLPIDIGQTRWSVTPKLYRTCHPMNFQPDLGQGAKLVRKHNDWDDKPEKMFIIFALKNTSGVTINVPVSFVGSTPGSFSPLMLNTFSPDQTNSQRGAIETIEFHSHITYAGSSHKNYTISTTVDIPADTTIIFQIIASWRKENDYLEQKQVTGELYMLNIDGLMDDPSIVSDISIMLNLERGFNGASTFDQLNELWNINPPELEITKIENGTLGIYADSTEATAGGVNVGEYYINSSTYALTSQTA